MVKKVSTSEKAKPAVEWRVWKQGELGFACGAYALMTAAYNMGTRDYGDCDLKAFRFDVGQRERFLTSGLSRLELAALAANVGLVVDRIPPSRIEPSTLSPVLVCLRQTRFTDPKPPHETDRDDHWVLLLNRGTRGYYVADSHPWNDDLGWRPADVIKYGIFTKGRFGPAVIRKAPRTH